MASIERSSMTRQEAEDAIARIRAGIESIGAIILDLYDRQGWKSLGYPSWRECVQAEFGWAKSQAYRQLQAARINLELSPMGETMPSLNERQARELARIPDPAQRAEVWERVSTTHGERVTAQHIREAIRSEDAPPYDAAPCDPPLLAVVDVETGEIVSTVEARASVASSDRTDEADMVAGLIDVPDMREPTDEERSFDRMIRLSTITKLDPAAVAAAAARYRASSARDYLERSTTVLSWHERFVAALRQELAEPLRLVR